MISGYPCGTATKCQHRSRIAPVQRKRLHNDTQVQPDNRATQKIVILHVIYKVFDCYKELSMGSGKAKRNFNNQHNVQNVDFTHVLQCVVECQRNLKNQNNV